MTLLVQTHFSYDQKKYWNMWLTVFLAAHVCPVLLIVKTIHSSKCLFLRFCTWSLHLLLTNKSTWRTEICQWEKSQLFWTISKALCADSNLVCPDKERKLWCTNNQPMKATAADDGTIGRAMVKTPNPRVSDITVNLHRAGVMLSPFSSKN